MILRVSGCFAGRIIGCLFSYGTGARSIRPPTRSSPSFPRIGVKDRRWEFFLTSFFFWIFLISLLNSSSWARFTRSSVPFSSVNTSSNRSSSTLSQSNELVSKTILVVIHFPLDRISSSIAIQGISLGHSSSAIFRNSGPASHSSGMRYPGFRPDLVARSPTFFAPGTNRHSCGSVNVWISPIRWLTKGL